MKNNIRFRLIIALLAVMLAGLACQTVMGGGPQAPLPTTTNTPIPPEQVPSEPAPTATLEPTAAPTPTATYVPVESSLQLAIFQELWEIVNEEYLYPDFNGVDWDAIYDTYRQRVEAGMDTTEFYYAMDELLYELGDEHSGFMDPVEVAAEEAEYAGDNDYVGVGIWVQFNPDKDKAVVLLTFPGGPAEAAGVQAHDSILSVEGVGFDDEEGAALNMLLGVEGTPVTFTVQTPGEEPRQLTVNRGRITSPIPVLYEALITPGGERIGYIVIPTFSDSTIPEQVGAALSELKKGGPLKGLILDNRLNSGGWDNVASQTLGYFTSGLTGHFVNRYEQEAFRIRRKNVGGSANLPLAVLVGPDTVSFGEIFAGILKDQGRATIIGETTLGNVEVLWGYGFEDGSRAWIAHDRFEPVNNPGADWEHNGIIVDIEAPSDWDEHTTETDPAVEAALIYFDGD